MRHTPAKALSPRHRRDSLPRLVHLCARIINDLRIVPRHRKTAAPGCNFPGRPGNKHCSISVAPDSIDNHQPNRFFQALKIYRRQCFSLRNASAAPEKHPRRIFLFPSRRWPLKIPHRQRKLRMLTFISSITHPRSPFSDSDRCVHRHTQIHSVFRAVGKKQFLKNGRMSRPLREDRARPARIPARYKQVGNCRARAASTSLLFPMCTARRRIIRQSFLRVICSLARLVPLPHFEAHHPWARSLFPRHYKIYGRVFARCANTPPRFAVSDCRSAVRCY